MSLASESLIKLKEWFYFRNCILFILLRRQGEGGGAQLGTVAHRRRGGTPMTGVGESPSGEAHILNVEQDELPGPFSPTGGGCEGRQR